MSKLIDVSKLITKGTTPSTIGEEFVSEGINFVKSESIGGQKYLDSSIFEHITAITNEKMKRSQLEADDLLFSIAGAYLGKIGIVREEDLPLNTNQAVGIVRLDKDKVDVDYIYYFFSQKRINEYINRLSSQSGQPNLNLELLGNLEFIDRTQKEQKRIGKILTSLDNKIELNNKINAELESMAKTIYDYWFLQFEFPNEEGKPYKSSGGKMVWNEELKREIPEGWGIIKLKDIFSFIKGKIPEQLYDVNGDNLYPYITIDVANNGVCQYCNKENMPFCNGEVIMVMDGAASGDIYIGNEGVLGSTFAMMSKKKADISDALLYCILQAQSTLYKKANTGSTVPHANRKFIEEIKIPIKSDMSEFSTVFDNIFNIIIFNKKENQELVSLRDFLLPLLMNGQVGFKE